MKSMTGYGKGKAASGGREITVELKAVNNRFLEINTRLPKAFLALDEVIRSAVSAAVKRGTVEVYFSYTNTEESEQKLIADIPLIKQYASLAREIEHSAGVNNDLAFSTLLRLNDAIKTQQRDEDIEALTETVREAVAGAIDSLDQMRRTEGAAIKKDFLSLLGQIDSLLAGVKERAPQTVEEYRQKLKERIAEFLSSVKVDEAKLLNETAFFADKADINEEIQRLASHMAQFAATLDSHEPQGRKLDFICQEIGREINTIGSKCSDTAIAGAVIEMKNILEKIKEQIRNVE